MNERYTPEDFETLRQAQFRYEERLRHLEERMNQLYTPQRVKETEEDIRAEIEAERRQVFIALGLEQIDDNDLIT